MPPDVNGIVTPVQTPFDDHGNLVLEQVEDSVEFAIECGSVAIVAAGTGVQETPSLTPDERESLISETLDAVDGRVPVFAGCAYPAKPVAARLANHAADAGADALLSFPPWGTTPTTTSVERYYEDLAAETDLPLLLYNNPTVTIDLPREVMARIAEINGVEYVKETSRNFQKISWLLEHVQRPGNADVFGTYDVLLGLLLSGGSGAVVPTPATVPAVKVFEAYRNDNLEAAMEHQRTFTRFPPEKVESNGLMQVMKAGAEIAGVAVGPPRNPYHCEALDGDERDALEQWMTENDVPRMTQ